MTGPGAAAGELILLGKITKPHGIRGEVKIYPYSGQPENFLHYREIFVGREEGGERIPYTIDTARLQGNSVLVKLTGCTSRNDAEALVGSEIWLRRQDLPALDQDEYYLVDLEGKTALTEDGREIGRITGIMATGAHDVLSVTGRGREYLIPLRPEFIVRMDDREVVLQLPPGLLEINEN